MSTPARPTLAVWKFASCDGCQLSLLDAEADLLALGDRVDIAHFAEATSHVAPGPYDLSLVEGSVATARDAARILAIRAQSKRLVTIGACATAGGIQALRNFANTAELLAAVYPDPRTLDVLAEVTPIRAHVPVDFELPGCPVDRGQLLEVIAAMLAGRPPAIATHSVCVECKQRGTTCVLVARGVACLGPVTHAGCGAICPAYDRGCYGCFGPMETADPAALAKAWARLGIADRERRRALHAYCPAIEPFRSAGAERDP
ncbi:MAG: oxidoreductase [Gammaproteobacteria bacterium]|nr:oxidoreductase [Gammaproteobacteria bacterium]